MMQRGQGWKALDRVWFDAVGKTMGINDLSREQWDAMRFDQQKKAVIHMLSTLQALSEGDDVQDVVDDVLDRAKKYGFKPDWNMVSGTVEESANLLNIGLSEDQITDACDRIMNLEKSDEQRPRG